MRRSSPSAALTMTMGMTITRATTMALRQGSKRRHVRGRPMVRDAGLRPAPHHEADHTHEPASLILRSRAQRGVSKDEAPTSPHDLSALYRLMAWLSPSYPVGAFSYSSGLEWAVEAGDVTDEETLRRWLHVVMQQGSGMSDAVFLVHAHRAVINADNAALHDVAELAAAFAPSKERHLETTAQGRAFVEATRAAWPCAALDRLLTAWEGAIAYPIAVAVTSGGHGIVLAPALHAHLHALAANQISAGLRLIPLGQTDGQRLLAALEPIIVATAKRALATPLDDIG